jgi:hypothetical protein
VVSLPVGLASGVFILDVQTNKELLRTRILKTN